MGISKWKCLHQSISLMTRIVMGITVVPSSLFTASKISSQIDTVLIRSHSFSFVFMALYRHDGVS